jgi:hypothetical protein
VKPFLSSIEAGDLEDDVEIHLLKAVQLVETQVDGEGNHKVGRSAFSRPSSTARVYW